MFMVCLSISSIGDSNQSGIVVLYDIINVLVG